MQRVVSEDILQALAAKTADGYGLSGVDPVIRQVYAAKSVELWVTVTALTAGGPMDFILESAIAESPDPATSWVEVTRISIVTVVGTYASAMSIRGDKPLGEKVRGRWEFSGGVGAATFEMRVVRQE